MINITHPELAEISNKALPPASVDALKSLRNQMCETSKSSFTLQSQQKFLRRVLSPDSPVRSLLMFHGTGVGKCHGLDTPILMFDGSVKMVQDIHRGELLMGDDSSPRQVLSLARGRDEMYRIKSIKGDSYIVNSEHILCLQHTSKNTSNNITEITVRDFLSLSKKMQRNLKGYRVPITFETKSIDFDPYILGVWLGDGSKRDPIISSQESKILEYIRIFCKENNAMLNFQSGYDYRISSISKKYENVFLKFLQTHNLINNKHIPDLYKLNSRDIQLQVLAGLIDTDGYLINNVFEITQKSKKLSDDIVFLCRSLGFAVTTRMVEKACNYKGEKRVGTYYRTFISGDINVVPTKVLRKHASTRKQIKNHLRYGITIEPLGEGDYYGFTLDGNNRYLLGDFTVTHNTCSAIQVAEEYILRPEFQDKKVLIVASAAVQDNFRTQIFDMSRVNLNPISNILSSQQCTGRRYLDMLLRIEQDPKNWNNPEIRDRLEKTSKKLIEEFYQFIAYASFGNMLNEKLTGTEAEIDKEWVHATFDNRLVIIDEAHNLRESKDSAVKGVTSAMEKLVKIANNMTLVFLSATPMFDTYDEILFFMNLCLWNDRRQPAGESIKAGDIFNPDATVKSEKFREWCSEYVSYVKGDSPFTFPFRLPPPKYVTTNQPQSFLGKSIGNEERLQYISLVPSQAQGIQQEVLSKVKREDTSDDEQRRILMEPTIIVLPKSKRFEDIFRSAGKQYEYVDEPCLSVEQLPNHSAKFATIINTITNSKGIALVYSNYKKYGTKLFAMALEEHGFKSANGNNLLANPSYSGTPKGNYILLTSDASEAEISKMLSAVKSPNNRDGNQIRIVICSPIVSEGIDFRYMRQVHILDPWWNASRIEQVVGRGLRTCSHQLLPFEEQNCTVYYHVVRTGDKECFDEYTYRTKVVPKAIKIARVRKVMAESAMDCPLQNTINTLPEDWKQLEVPQKRTEGPMASYKLSDMLGPTFDDTPDVAECLTKPSEKDPDHVRPLSTYLDVRDELITKLGRLFIDKPIWDREELLKAMKPYTNDVVIFNIQQAISSGTKFEDAFGRPSLLESHGDLYALAPIGVPNATLVERTQKPPVQGRVPLPEIEKPVQTEEIKVEDNILETKREEFAWPLDTKTRFDEMTLNGYIFDHKFTEEEKRAYLQTHPKDLPYANRLYVPGTDIIVMSKPTDLVFENKTRYEEWNDALLETFISRKEQVFATLNTAGKLAIARMKTGEGPLQRETNVKRFEPIACGTGDYAKDNIIAISKKVDKNGVGVPLTVEVKGKQKPVKAEEMCMYLELLMREEHNCFWLTPEEYKVLYDGAGSKKDQTNQYKFSQAFKK